MNRIKKITILSVLITVIIIMAFTPLGYLRIGAISASFLTIPIAIGAVSLGSSYAAILGLVFGITSFVQCFGIDAFGTSLMNIHPIYTFILCIPTRILAGALSGVIYKKVSQKLKKASYFITGFFGAALNTIFFVFSLIVLFWNTEYIREISNGKSIFAFIIFIVGINGIIEMITTTLVSGVISSVIKEKII